MVLIGCYIKTMKTKLNKKKGIKKMHTLTLNIDKNIESKDIIEILKGVQSVTGCKLQLQFEFEQGDIVYNEEQKKEYIVMFSLRKQIEGQPFKTNCYQVRSKTGGFKGTTFFNEDEITG